MRSTVAGVLFVLVAFPALGSIPGDDCAGAIAVASVPQTITTPLDGTAGQPTDPRPSCYPASIHNTVWYRYTPSFDMQVRLDSGGDVNTTIAVFIGTCGAPTEIDCDWQYGLNDYESHGAVDFLSEAGTTYTIMIASPFAAPPGTHYTLSAAQGQSAPITVTVRDQSSELPLAGAHVWLRDREGGNYTLRDGFTGSDGRVTLYPSFRLQFDAHSITPGFQNDAAAVSNAAGPESVDLRLAPLGPIAPPPSWKDEPRIAASSGACILTLLPDGTDMRWICPGTLQVRDPVFSPDGSKIAFFARDWVGEAFSLFIVGVDGTELHLVSNIGRSTAENLSWAPDGRYLIYDGFEPWAGYSSIYQFDLETETETRLIDFAAAGRYSPDGTMIAYDGSSGVRVARADGSDPMAITTMFGHPAWSPDGRRIAVNAGASGANEGITVMNVDGTGVRQVHGTAWQVDQYPVWSPDGARILFLDGDLESYYLTLVDVETGAIQRIHRQDSELNSRIDWASRPTYDTPHDESPAVDVLTPDGGEWYRPGETVTIRWFASDDYAIATQDVFLHHGGESIVLAADLGGDVRGLDWTAPAGLWAFADAWIDIEVTDTVGQQSRDFSNYAFSVAQPNQGYMEIDLHTPIAGERYEPGQQVTIAWEQSAYFSIADFTLELSTDGGFTWSYIDFAPAGARSYQWIVPDRPTTRAYLRILPWSANGTTWDEVGPFAIGVNEIAAVDLHEASTNMIHWEAFDGAGSYDVVRAPLASLRTIPHGLGRVSFGDEGVCHADDTPLTSVMDENTPLPGEAWIYVIQPNTATPSIDVLGLSSGGWELRPAVGGCQ